MTLQQQVQQHLDNTGISLRELSRRSGVSHTTIGKILKGGTYKSDTAHALYSLISITPVSEYVTLDATVEQLAAQRVNADLTHHADWDVDLQCAKYRRVMQLEKELEQTQDLLKQREQHLKSCENALIEANEKLEDSQHLHSRAMLLLSDERKENKRLTALSETHGQSWKAASVQVEQLQKQLDHGQAQFKSLQAAYDQQIDDEREMLAQIDTPFAERENAETKHDQQIMRLRVYVWSLICAIMFLIVSGFVVWGGV